MRAAITHGHAKALCAADHHISTPLPGRSEHGEGEQVSGHAHLRERRSGVVGELSVSGERVVSGWGVELGKGNRGTESRAVEATGCNKEKKKKVGRQRSQRAEI